MAEADYQRRSSTQYGRASWDAFDVDAYFERLTARGFGSSRTRRPR